MSSISLNRHDAEAIERESKCVELFEQIDADLGHKQRTYSNVERFLKSIGWKHNNAVRASVDFMAWKASND